MGTDIDKRGRVLVVDNEPEFLTALCEGLAKQGFEAIGVTSGAEALEMLKEHEFDLLLSDLTMPGMDGVELLRASLELDPDIVGIVMTGQATTQTVVEAMKAGAVEFVQKPFKILSLLPILSKAVELRKLRMENLQLRETMAMYELGQAIAFTLEADTILRKVVDAVHQQCNADEVSIMLLTPHNNELYVAAAHGERHETILGKRIPVEQGIAGWVARSRTPLTLDGTVNDPRFAPVAPRTDIRAAMSIPMLAGGNLVGVLNVNATGRRTRFTLGQLKAVSILANIAAVAFENAQLYTQVREAEEQYRSIFQNVVEGIFRLTPDGRYVTANPALVRMYGYASSEELIAHLTDIGRQLYLDPGRWAELTSRLTKLGEISGQESQVYRKDGKVIWISESARAFRDAGGKLLWYDGTVTDITARRRAEEALSYTQFAIDRAVDPTFFIRQDGKFFYANEAACLTLGYTKDELCTMRVSDIDPDHPPATWEAHWQRTREGKIITYASHHRTKDGRVFPVEITTNHLDYEGVEYNCAFVRDLTERKQLETRVRQTQKMEAVGQLAGGIAHDFNNILSAIFGYSQLIESEAPKDSELRERVDQILIAAGRARDLVKQILAFSRQGEDDEPTPLMIGLIIREVLSLLRASLPSTIEIRPTLDPACGMILANSTQVHQVVMNLCTNAEHAMRGQSGVLDIGLREITLDAHVAAHHGVPEGRYAELRISDTGHGMPPEVREHIFEPFFTTKAVGEGSGMGLAVIHGIVRRHDGAITVESKVGEGTTFEILFPVIADKPREGEEPSENESLDGTECILFVDDEPALTKMFQRMLEQCGYTVVARTSSTEALELFRHAPARFDVVVTDQTMPSMTGVELASEILQIRPEMPIILCSGYSVTVSPELATSMGIREFVRKPIITEDLTRIIRKICDQPHEE